MVEERGGEVYAGMLGLGGVAEGQLRSWPLQRLCCPSASFRINETESCFSAPEYREFTKSRIGLVGV